MAAPTSGEFIERFPEFTEISSSVLESVITEAGNITPETIWGPVHQEAVSYLAAHLLATRTIQIGTQVGSTTGQALGPELESTLYGQAYLRLFRTLPVSGFAL